MLRLAQRRVILHKVSSWWLISRGLGDLQPFKAFSSDNNKPMADTNVANAPKPEKQSKKNKKKGSVDATNASATVDLSVFKDPEYAKHRIDLWDQIKAKRAEESKATEGAPIQITLPDGKVVEGKAGVSTPYDVAVQIASEQFAKKFIVARVDGKLHDYGLPISKSCNLELLSFDTPEGKHVFWHSSAHVLGEALEARYGGRLAVGPPIDEGGFFYDIELKDQ
jgi:threonyl-tRNA synthetase